MYKLLFVFSALLLFSACRTAKPVEEPVPEPVVAGWAGSMRGAAPAAMPMGRIYRVEPQWAMNVPVAVDNGRIVSFPAPSDISSATAPIRLSDGWWLDRQGIGPNTVFLKWTRDEYAALPSTPSIAEIKEAIVPSARPDAIYQLPMSASEAAADTAAVNRIIADGLSGCKSLTPILLLKD